jgi:hypothetical protein
MNQLYSELGSRSSKQTWYSIHMKGCHDHPSTVEAYKELTAAAVSKKKAQEEAVIRSLRNSQEDKKKSNRVD